MRNGLYSLVLAAVTVNVGACDKQSSAPPQLSAELRAGKAVVEGTCKKCHAQGVNGAPIIGNSRMWGPRAQQGVDTLVEHAINGFNMEMMPPRGGNPELSDEQIRLAVTFMLSQIDAKSD